jgi:hypothetical protein
MTISLMIILVFVEAGQSTVFCLKIALRGILTTVERSSQLYHHFFHRQHKLKDNYLILHGKLSLICT